MKNLVTYIFALVLIVACKPSRPDGVLSPGEMEDILFDMHKAQAVYDQKDRNTNPASIIAIRANVLENHDVTRAEWDSSFNYYTRNADQLYGIYNSLAERIQDDVLALGGKINGAEGMEADTANVWNQEPAFILMQQAPYNVVSFTVMPDSTFEDGDRLTLQYDCHFLFQDGYRDVTTYIAVYYSNDSIATQTIHTTGDGQGVLTVINDVNRLHVEKIRGFFMLSQNIVQATTDLNSSLLHLASITNVRLLHLHSVPPAPATSQPVEKPDSVNTDSLKRDSMLKASVINK